MKNSHKFRYILTIAALSAVLLSGCTNERLEDELAFREIGISNMQKGDYEGAIVAFSSALALCSGEITNTEIDICYYKAAALYASGDIEGAAETYQALIDYNEKDGNAYYLRGCLNLQKGDSKQALFDFSNAVKYNGDDFEIYIGIYENLTAYNMTEEGEEYLNKAFDIKGSSAENLAYRGKIYYLLGQYENAQKELTAAIEKESKEANLYLAQVYEAEGNMEKAENFYQAYTASGVADSVAMNALAEIEIGKGNYGAALDYVKQGLAMEDVTNRAELLSNQVIASEYSGDFETAQAAMQEYLSLCPEDAEAQREYIFLKNRRIKEKTPETGNEQDRMQDTQQSTEITDTENTNPAESTDNNGQTE